MKRRVVAHGPFALKPSFAREQWFVTGFAMLFLLAVGPGALLTYGFYDRYLTELERQWGAYRAAAEPATYEGRIRTTRMVLHHYELEVSFRTQEGAHITFQTEFWRLLTGPDRTDTLQVRYDLASPQQALTSWEFGTTQHGHYYANAALLIGLTSVLLGALFVRDVTRRIAAIKELARNSQLVVASVTRLRELGTPSTRMLQITFCMPGGTEQTQVFYAKLGQPYFVHDNQHVLILSSLDERIAHIVRQDGYPLAERPVV